MSLHSGQCVQCVWDCIRPFHMILCHVWWFYHCPREEVEATYNMTVTVEVPLFHLYHTPILPSPASLQTHHLMNKMKLITGEGLR